VWGLNKQKLIAAVANCYWAGVNGKVGLTWEEWWVEGAIEDL
jgi:hypothetical protein